jgi:hypothetical protein
VNATYRLTPDVNSSAPAIASLIPFDVFCLEFTDEDGALIREGDMVFYLAFFTSFHLPHKIERSKKHCVEMVILVTLVNVNQIKFQDSIVT